MRDLDVMLGEFAPLLIESGVVEVSLNPSGAVFVERFGIGTAQAGIMGAAAAERFVRFCAAAVNESLSEANPILSSRVPGTTHRIEALLPPVVRAPSFSIRRHAERVIELEDFLGDAQACAILKEAIGARENILIAGSTGSGKTTLVNSCLACLAQITPDARLLVLEDTPELQVGIANVVHLQSAPVASLDRLLVSSLRLSPDRIILGEVRTGAVLMTLLKAWNTGHPGGLTTIHANSARETIERMKMLASEVSVSDQTALIHQAIRLIVFISREFGPPRLRQIIRLHPDHHSQTEILYDA